MHRLSQCLRDLCQEEGLHQVCRWLHDPEGQGSGPVRALQGPLCHLYRHPSQLPELPLKLHPHWQSLSQQDPGQIQLHTRGECFSGSHCSRRHRGVHPPQGQADHFQEVHDQYRLNDFRFHQRRRSTGSRIYWQRWVRVSCCSGLFSVRRTFREWCHNRQLPSDRVSRHNRRR